MSDSGNGDRPSNPYGPPPPQGGPPNYGQPQGGQPQGGPQYGAPQGGPQYGAPQGGPQYGAPQYGQGGYAGAPGVAQANTGLVSIAGLGTVKVATIGQRFLARLIDTGIYLAVGLILSVAGVASLVGSTEYNPETGMEEPSGAGLAGMILMLGLIVLFGMIYELAMIAVKGQTLGKMAMGVKVVLEHNGQVPGWGPSFVRAIIPWGANFVCSILGLLCYISVFFDNSGRNQTWYDKAANDLVISTK